jgi:curved DNA-binding protein CbpA
MGETFYSVLGVDRDADSETIRAAYRELVKDHHPDVSDEADATERFKRITQARDVLLEESDRSRYDRVGHNTYVRRYMDGSAWSIDESAGGAAGGRSTTRSGRGSGGGSSTGRAGGAAGGDGTAHNYERYRSHGQSETADVGEEEYRDRRRRRSWADDGESDWDWSTEESSTADASAGATGDASSTAAANASSTARNDSDPRQRAYSDGWETAHAATNAYTPTGAAGAGPTGDHASFGTIQGALKEVGPWLAFHFVFLMSAFVSILLLMSWMRSITSIFISMLLLGAAVFFSVLHMVSRVYT